MLLLLILSLLLLFLIVIVDIFLIWHILNFENYVNFRFIVIHKLYFFLFLFFFYQMTTCTHTFPYCEYFDIRYKHERDERSPLCGKASLPVENRVGSHDPDVKSSLHKYDVSTSGITFKIHHNKSMNFVKVNKIAAFNWKWMTLFPTSSINQYDCDVSFNVIRHTSYQFDVDYMYELVLYEYISSGSLGNY